jgi:hypothetical protein
LADKRIELASTGRAGCNSPACKKHKLKIPKGGLRLGSWGETEQFQSWSWRHWFVYTALFFSFSFSFIIIINFK